MFCSRVDKYILGFKKSENSGSPSLLLKRATYLVTLSRSQFPDFPDIVKFMALARWICFSIFLSLSLWSVRSEAAMKGPLKTLIRSALKTSLPFLNKCCLHSCGFPGRVTDYRNHLWKWICEIGMKPKLERAWSQPSPVTGTKRSCCSCFKENSSCFKENGSKL